MISHHHKTVFVHIPKCAGTSIEEAFLTDAGIAYEQRLVMLMGYNENPMLGPPALAHLRAVDYLNIGYVAPWQKEDYFWFSVCRCPIRRLLSTYNYFGGDISLSKFVQEWLPEELQDHGDHGVSFYYFIRPQIDFVTDSDGKLLVDRIYKIEGLTETSRDIAMRSGLRTAIPHINRSHIKNVRPSDLSRSDLEVIEEIYACDFDYFGYERPM